MQVTPSPRSERGFSMFIVIMAMFVTSMFVAAGFAAAQGGLSLSVENKNRKSSYNVAEAGLGYYLKELKENPDVWTRCAGVDAPNGTEKSPINQQWDGSGSDPRIWRKIPGVNAEYTIEILHQPGFPLGCDTTKQESVIDMSSGTFRIRITGRATSANAPKRSVIVTFMRTGFLKFVYFTDQENRDPQAATSASTRSAQQAACVGKTRTQRVGQGCTEIQFATGDAINGPLHTNDESVLICGTPTFGRQKNKNGTTVGTDVIEVSGGTPGYVQNSGCSTLPTVYSANNNKFTTGVKKLALPESNTELQTVAETAGKAYSGKTIVYLNGTTMDVRNYNAAGVATTTNAVPWPANGVLYVKNNGACTGEIPTDADYDEPFACGNVYVSGTYSKPLTIAAANDVIIRPTVGAKLDNSSTNSDITLVDGSNATLGLIANNFVRVGHKVNRGATPCANAGTTTEPAITNVRVDAAIMSLQHSFMVDNYDCGLSGKLTVNGAIVQKFRGAVGTGSPVVTGYLKDYWYDDRLRYRNPPYFLNPLKADWEVIGTTEQVPAR